MPRLLAFLLVATAASAVDKTVWSGIYTAEQASRGASVYAGACSRCHREDLSGYSGLQSEKFIDNWREDSLRSLWLRISQTMPMGAPGTLTEAQYLDVLAFLLKANEFPAGTQELRVAELPNIRFELKDGPKPVPDFALVETVGCLAQDPDQSWRVRQATPLRRTRNPNASTAPELQSAGEEKLGALSFRILDSSSLKVDTHLGRKAKVKGFLIRKPNDDRLNPTAIEILSSCP